MPMRSHEATDGIRVLLKLESVSGPWRQGAAGARKGQMSSDRILPLQRRLKRLIDLLGAGLGLVLLAPFMAAVVVLIRLDSSGPAIFKQTRVGKDGRPFTFYKFRSMYCNTRSDVHEQYMAKLIEGEDLDSLTGTTGSFKLEDDSRVTRVGRILRRTSIDELPQLANVLLGQMSLVGPRPALEYEVDSYKDPHFRRLEAVPGMTGLWQVSGRTKTSFEEMVSLDIAYIDNWSLPLDIRILWQTVFVVLGREGAW